MKSKYTIKYIFNDKGKKTGVLISVEDFEKIMQELEDLQDLATVYEVKSKKFKPIPYEKIRKELFGKNAKK